MSPVHSKSIASSSRTAQRLDGTCSHIPEEMIEAILLRLPVKHLLRIRCVCKQWCYLIDSNKFVKQHLQRSIKCNPDSGLIFKSFPGGGELSLTDVDHLHNVTFLQDPLRTQLYLSEFIGACNGLVCLWSPRLLKTEINDILLWNPATRKVKGLPIPTDFPLPSRLGASSVVGFGFDHLNDDYKVVRTFDSRQHGIMVTIYSLKSNSWKRGETVTSHIRLITFDEICLNRTFGKFANGSLHWLATYDNGGDYWLSKSLFIFAFDLGVERHRVIPFPAGVDKTDEHGMALTVFNNSLCLIDLYVGIRTNIWLMNDNGVANSWSKLLSMELPGGMPEFLRGPHRYVWPIANSKTPNDVLLVVDRSILMFYDCKRNIFKGSRHHRFPCTLDLLVYTESLFQLSYDSKTDGKLVPPEQSEEKEQIQEVLDQE